MNFFFFFNDTATTEIYTLSLHDALPIFVDQRVRMDHFDRGGSGQGVGVGSASGLAGHQHQQGPQPFAGRQQTVRSEEHTSELQSRQYLVCRLLLEKKKK